MTGACPGPDEAAGVAHGMLEQVGCNAHETALEAYAAITGPHSFLPTAVTASLTIYVALLGWGLLSGTGVRLKDVSKMGLKIGAVLALALNWTAFQTLVFDLAANAPAEVGRIFTVAGGAEDDPLSRLEAIHGELTESAKSLLTPQGAPAAPGQLAATVQQPPAAQTLFGLANTLLLSTVGLISLAMVVQAVLVALGPAFILLFLFDSTRGLFVGWVRALVGAMIAPMTSWGGLMICLTTLEPWADRLAAERNAHAITLDTISSLAAFVATFAAAQAATALGAIVVALAFQLPRPVRARAETPPGAMEGRPASPGTRVRVESRAERLAHTLRGQGGFSSAIDVRRLDAFAGAGRTPEAAGPIPRLGDAYRRPSPAARFGRAAPPPPGRAP